MIPPRAGEMTASHSRSRNLSASCAQTRAAIVRVLEEKRALEKLPAVQTRPEHKVPVEQRAGLAKERKQIVVHLSLAVLKAMRTCGSAFLEDFYPDVSPTVLPLVARHGDDFDLDLRALGQRRDGDGRTRRRIFRK